MPGCFFCCAIPLITRCRGFRPTIRKSKHNEIKICVESNNNLDKGTIASILNNPDKYQNQVVTVEGIFGGRVGYFWLTQEPIFGIYDEKDNGINVLVNYNMDKLMEESVSTYGVYNSETYNKVYRKYYEHIDSMIGKRVRITGIFSEYLPPYKDNPKGGPVITIILPQFDGNPTSIEVVPGLSNYSSLHATVIDYDTGIPVKGSIVYLGYHSPTESRCCTDEKGQCTIENFVYGDYSLNVFKKGYNRFSEPIHFNRGDNFLIIRIKKSSAPTKEVIVRGMVREIITAKGSRSENHYLKIIESNGKEWYLFNEIGENYGFENYIGDTVEIKGFIDIGYIGWQHEPVEGIYVEQIRKLNHI